MEGAGFSSLYATSANAVRPRQVGRYYAAAGVGIGSATVLRGRLYPNFLEPQNTAWSIDQVSVNVQTAVAAQTFGIALYEVLENGNLGAVLASLGTPSDISTTGQKDITVSFSIPANTPAYLTGLCIGGASDPAFRCYRASVQYLGHDTAANALGATSPAGNMVSGGGLSAFAANPTVSTWAGSGPIMAYRVA
jgi:hypothetical protein